MFVVILMFSVKTCLRKKVSHLAETAGNSTLLAWRKRERERNGGNCGQSRKC